MILPEFSLAMYHRLWIGQVRVSSDRCSTLQNPLGFYGFIDLPGQGKFKSLNRGPLLF